MAAILPTSVEFHIHQVLPIFQIKIAAKQYQKKCIFLVLFSAIKNSGQIAIKIKKLSGETGQAANSIIPDKKLNPTKYLFFKEVNFIG
jgi:hypothetical protein